VPVAAAVLVVGWRGRWIGQGVSLYRIAQTTISAVATIWITPSPMNTAAPMAMACAVIRTDDSSHTPNASRLMPAEQRALMRWEICGTYAAPARPAPIKPAICVAVSIADICPPLCTKWYMYQMVHSAMRTSQAREHLLAAAVDHALSDGIADPSLRQLAAAIGTSHRMLLYHFGSR